TVVFAVGDRVDERFGLPYKDGLYVTAPEAAQDAGAAYQVWDPQTLQPITGIYVVGWARRASDGVVGRARLDAETRIKRARRGLASIPKRSSAEAEHVISAVLDELARGGTAFVTYPEVLRIEEAERRRATEAGVEEHKFKSDEERLALLRRQLTARRRPNSSSAAAPIPYAAARSSGSLPARHGQKTAPLGKGECISPKSVATAQPPNTAAARPSRPSMIETSAHPQRRPVTTKPLPSAS